MQLSYLPTPILSISSDHNLNLINILAQFFPGPISWPLFLQLLCFFHWFYSKHLQLLSKFLLHPFQCIWDIINLILLETSGAFMTCSPLDGFISTHLHSCHLGIPFPSLPFVSVMMELLHPILCIFLFPCFTHSFWRNVSTASCTEDAKKVSVSRTCVSENTLILS